MANHTGWTGATGDKLYLTSGEFESTLKFSLYVGAIDNTPNSLSADESGANTLWGGGEADKHYLNANAFGGILLDSQITENSVLAGLHWDGTNTPYVDHTNNRLYLSSGQMQTTLKDSLPTDTWESSSGTRGVCEQAGNTPWIGTNDSKMYLNSGQFETTQKDSSATTGGSNAYGIDVDDTPNTIASAHDTDLLVLHSGVFETTLKASRDVTAIDNLLFGVAAWPTTFLPSFTDNQLTDDFEDGLGEWVVSGAPTVDAGAGFGSTQGISFDAVTEIIRYLLDYATTTLYFGFHLKLIGDNDNLTVIVQWQVDTFPQCSWLINSNTGDSKAYTANNPASIIMNDTATGLEDKAWHWVDFKVFCSNSGIFEWRIDESVVSSNSPVDTLDTGGPLMNAIRIQGRSSAQNYVIDNVYINATEYEGPPTTPGLVKAVAWPFSYGRSHGGLVA